MAEIKKPFNPADNLVPITSRSSEERRQICRKGGLVRSENRKIAARLRELKKKGMTDETFKRIYDVATDSESSALDILLFLEKWKNEVKKPMEAVQMGHALVSLHKAKFGEIQKQQIQQENHNLNVNMNINPITIDFKFNENTLNFLKDIEDRRQSKE